MHLLLKYLWQQSFASVSLLDSVSNLTGRLLFTYYFAHLPLYTIPLSQLSVVCKILIPMGMLRSVSAPLGKVLLLISHYTMSSASFQLGPKAPPPCSMTIISVLQVLGTMGNPYWNSLGSAVVLSSFTCNSQDAISTACSLRFLLY